MTHLLNSVARWARHAVAARATRPLPARRGPVGGRR